MPICCVALILRHCGVPQEYASFLGISRALHLDISEQPPGDEFLDRVSKGRMKGRP